MAAVAMWLAQRVRDPGSYHARQPQRPELEVTHRFIGCCVEIVGGLAYLAGRRWSPDDYKQPSPLVTRYQRPQPPSGGRQLRHECPAFAVQVSETKRCAATGEGLQIVDVTTPRT
jgi:hypothetical protein